MAESKGVLKFFWNTNWQALFVASVLTAKPVFVVSVLTAKPVTPLFSIWYWAYLQCTINREISRCNCSFVKSQYSYYKTQIFTNKFYLIITFMELICFIAFSNNFPCWGFNGCLRIYRQNYGLWQIFLLFGLLGLSKSLYVIVSECALWLDYIWENVVIKYHHYMNVLFHKFI